MRSAEPVTAADEASFRWRHSVLPASPEALGSHCCDGRVRCRHCHGRRPRPHRACALRAHNRIILQRGGLPPRRTLPSHAAPAIERRRVAAIAPYTHLALSHQRSISSRSSRLAAIESDLDAALPPSCSTSTLGTSGCVASKLDIAAAFRRRSLRRMHALFFVDGNVGVGHRVALSLLASVDSLIFLYIRFHHFTRRSAVRSPSSEAFTWARARARRDITVPIGTPWMSATSR